MKKYDIPYGQKIDSKIKLLKKTGNSVLYSFEGPAINRSVINSLKRIMESEIPCYGFHKNNITIKENTTIYNNYMTIHKIEMIPIIEEYHDVELFDNKRFLQNFENLSKKYDLSFYKNGKEIVLEESETQKMGSNESYLKIIEFSLNYHNKTTDDVKVWVQDGVMTSDNGKTLIKKDYKKYPKILISVLRPGEKLELNAKAILGIPKYGAMWSSCILDRYHEVNENSYEFGFSTKEQLTPIMVLQKACNIIIKKLDLINSYIKKKYNDTKDSNTTEQKIDIVLHHESQTIGQLLNFFLQGHPKVLYSGVSQPHLLIEEIVISVNTEKNTIKIIGEVIEYIKLVYQDILVKL